jgi:hypothetical protein
VPINEINGYNASHKIYKSMNKLLFQFVIAHYEANRHKHFQEQLG